MNDRNDDELLQGHYAATRRLDRRAAPVFDEAWRAARERSGERSSPAFRILAFAGVGAVVVVTIVLLATTLTDDAFETPSLSTWRAPTDSFLEIPGTEWLRSVPTIQNDLPGLAREEPVRDPGYSPSRRLRS